MALGVLRQKNGRYALRLLGSSGVFDSGALRSAAALADHYGDGTVTATSRGTLEVGGIEEESLDAALAEAECLGLRVGGTGATVRAVTACKGSVCTKGLFDVHALAEELDEAFVGLPTPKKFKIGVFGCPNSLGKAQGQDVGIQPHLPFHGTFDLYLGGRMGRVPAFGQPLGVPLEREKIVAAVALILERYQERALEGERFQALLEREPGLLEELKKECKALA